MLPKMNSKVLGLLVATLAVSGVLIVFIAQSLVPPQEAPSEMDFTVTGTNDCLRFLNSTVSTVYIPFRTGANEKWQLTINCTKMPGGVNGYTEVYIYKGYWDEGIDHKCIAEDLYPILNHIQSTDRKISGNSSFQENFEGSTTQSYTVFFIFPPGGQSAFQITYKNVTAKR